MFEIYVKVLYNIFIIKYFLINLRFYKVGGCVCFEWFIIKIFLLIFEFGINFVKFYLL